ncbi:helicase-related protein [Fimbriimonas ginsengisoli]|nr:helicase-related protein [Fimbriimonas ginsengisoli]
MSPVAAGLDALVKIPSDHSIEVWATISWNVYYRVRPSYEEQQTFQDPIRRDDEDNDDDSVGSPPPPSQPNTRQRERPVPKFKKLNCSASGPLVLQSHESGISVEAGGVNTAINAELARVGAIRDADPDLFRVGPRPDPELPNKLGAADMVSDQAYRRYWANLPDLAITPWAIRVDVSCEPSPEHIEHGRLVVDIVNVTPISEKDQVHEPFIFDTRLQLEFPSGCLAPFRLVSAPKDFRENPRMFGRGRNCAVEHADDTLSTTHTPMYMQGRYVTRETPEALTCELATDPFPTLEKLEVAMSSYELAWDQALSEFRLDPAWDDEQELAFMKDRALYFDEVSRFKHGLNLLRTNADVAYAFTLMNRAFERNALRAWRLMQIVFIVTQLPGLVAEDPMDQERETVDIIYFPTGGGKTEAYLAAVVFSCFWDRLRGKIAGVTAWARFPLRLLTAQQLQRFANIICCADLVRKAEPDIRLSGSNVDGFAVGYYVGSGGTPNSIQSATASNSGSGLPWAQAQDPTFIQKFKRIAVCPACRTRTVIVEFDHVAVVLRHKCVNESCAFSEGILPIYVVDNDLYRYLPSVMVGTLDKLAQIGIARKFGMILGSVDGRCPTHGYYNGKCCQDGCRETLSKVKPVGLSGPSLFVQDELHLLREGLGTFDSHYETLFQLLLNEAGTKMPIKILASSATIEQFERQVNQLYARSKARVFPGPGPKKGHSFYATTLNYPQRLYVGVLPHNKTLLNALFKLTESYVRGLGTLRGRYHTGPTFTDVSTLYSSCAHYFLANPDLDAFKTDLRDHVSPALVKDGFPQPTTYTLTGGTSADDVSGTLEALERSSAVSDPVQFVLATNTISHGVDIDRLNWMFFFGMPRQTAEYIQASSRVGRAYIGVVFTCFNPTRERDQSHYHYFAKQHEFLGKLVEPVPVNRWSKFSLDRTLPGAINAMLLHQQSQKLRSDRRNLVYILDNVKAMFASGELSEAEVESGVLTAYLGPQNNLGDPAFRARLQQRCKAIIFDQIETSVRPVTFVSDAMTPSPMRSLREVDEPVSIRLNSAGLSWSRVARAKGGGA